jgi:hypothetical protein
MKTKFCSKQSASKKAYEIAELAGIKLNGIAFSIKEYENLTKRSLSSAFKRKFRDGRVIGFANQKQGIICVSLPVFTNTLAHEITHLRCKTSHRTLSFANQVYALANGKPATAKKHKYIVTCTHVVSYEVWELSATLAKKHFRSIGEKINNNFTVKAHKTEP